MRLKRAKAYKKSMAVYQSGFGFRTPYQVLVDGEFCQAALQFHIILRDQVPNVLLGEAKLMTTACCVRELEAKGSSHTTAVVIAKKMETRRCPHTGRPVSAAECITEIVGPTNQHHYCVATQDPRLRARLREIPGTPLLLMSKSVLLLEPTSQCTLEKVRQLELAKVAAPRKEVEFLARVANGGRDPPAQQQGLAAQQKKRKRKGPKEPNPLSCKKKKVKQQQQPQQQKRPSAKPAPPPEK